MRTLLVITLALIACLHSRSAIAQNAPARDYSAVIKDLDSFIRHEIAHKRLPALSIALVDDQRTVWSAAFGFVDGGKTRPATADTVYRVGSVSKIYTNIAVMQLVEQKQLDLDAPVEKYLPEFKPVPLPTGSPISIRHIMTHKSGLCREPPVGNFFDSLPRSLKETVESLNQTTLIYPPGATTKYSNAGVAVLGRIVEHLKNKPFADCIRELIFIPAQMQRSDFVMTAALQKDLAAGLMWTLHGRESAAPTFSLGMAPAVSLNSTANDLASFLSVIFAGGRSIVKADTLAQMLKPQFAPADSQEGFGLGFYVSQLEGRRKFSHSGAIYGHAAEMAGLPDDKLGVVVLTTRDCANAVTERIAEIALRLMLAVKQNKTVVAPMTNRPLNDQQRSQLVPGLYSAEGEKEPSIRIVADGDRRWFWPLLSGTPVILGADMTGLVSDDPNDIGTRIDLIQRGQFRFANGNYRLLEDVLPNPCPEKWSNLVGEYGWDHETLYILEDAGRLYALIEWFFLFPLIEEGDGVFRFPPVGLYADERVVFARDGKGHATQVTAANVTFPRRSLPGPDGKTFQIQPLRAVDQLMREALAANPPAPKGELAQPDLVDLAGTDATLKFDIRYAGNDNFLGTPVYPIAKALLQRPAANALARAHKSLRPKGLGLLIHDAYRPWYVTKVFWDATPQAQRLFVADPAIGSRHNRGCAVDLTLYDLTTGRAVRMPGGYDEFSDRSYPNYPGGTARDRWYRDTLRHTMESEGFTVFEAEWWHFDHREWKKYPVLNLPLDVKKN